MFSECNPQREKHVQIISSPLWRMKCKQKGEWRAGRQNRGYSHQLRARTLQCKHVSRGEYASNKCEQARKSFEVISRIYKIAFHSVHNEKQKEALYNHRTPLFESLPETRCSVNAILKGKSMHRSSHPPNGKLAATKRQNPPRKKCKELQSSA